MTRFRSLIPGVALAVAFAGTSFVQAAPDADAKAGRALVTRYADTIVGVELVVTLKVKMGDREMPPREQRVDVNGTVINANGLTVTTLAEVDPQTAFEMMKASQPAARLELLGADFKEVKLRLADGTEIPAKFVLKDADLDLAFMAPDAGAPEATKREFAHVNLDDAAEGVVLGDYFMVSRAPKVLQRVPVVRESEILGIVEKPRKIFLLSEQALGSPMFDLQGRILGITLQHFANGRRTGLIVLPAADIAEMAKQALTAKPAPAPEPSTDKPAAPLADSPKLP
jgi:hypothetical protein